MQKMNLVSFKERLKMAKIENNLSLLQIGVPLESGHLGLWLVSFVCF